MGVPLFLVDAFADEAFTGNPAAVCFVPGPVPVDWMQSFAGEMNQAETAFLWPMNGAFSLRWFTPSAEVDLCGHATLASAHVLWETAALQPSEQAAFHTRSGLLTCSRSGDKITMDFPAVIAEGIEIPGDILEMFGGNVQWCGKNRMDLMVVLKDPASVTEFRPDFGKIGAIEARGIMITASTSEGRADFVSRFFAPRVGVPEDQVTGSAHCCRAPYWSKMLGKTKLTGYQASPRGGYVDVEVWSDRVVLGGRARMVMKGSVEEVPATVHV